MSTIKSLLSAAAMLTLSATAANAANLWIVGDATPMGWSLDDATALVSTVDDDAVYTGTIYLKADQNFKFMTVLDWGNEEYGAVSGTSISDGKIDLAKGTNDEGYTQIQVSENANYIVTVNTQSMTATIVKSAYQSTEITLASMFMVGDATPNGWSVDNGTPLRQVEATPYIYQAKKQALSEGSFKIATVIKGGGTWDAKYWYFRDADNADKIALGQDGDLQWSIADAGDYDVTVNLLDSSIKIEKSVSSGINEIVSDSEGSVEYYNLQGIKVETPENGLYIRRIGNKTEKVIVK